MERIIIVGGGIAGLTCLNALLDAGICVSLYEGGMIGSPKMCGEFIAPQAVELLRQWGMQSIYPILSAQFHVNSHSLTTSFIKAAGAVSRSEVELFLAQRARQLGGEIHENTSIQEIHPPLHDKQPYRLQLADGNEIQSMTVFFATGRLTAKAIQHFPYVGIKMHFPKTASLSTLQMFSVQNAYMGLVPISDSTCNFACLMKTNLLGDNVSIEDLILDTSEHYPNFYEVLQQIDLKNHFSLQVKTPEFGFRKVPDWHNAYWIGDALASVHPAIGSGFSHAMLSAHCAVHDYLKRTQQHSQLYKKQLKTKIQIGYCMHQLMLRPVMGSFAIKIAKQPRISNTLQSLLFN